MQASVRKDRPASTIDRLKSGHRYRLLFESNPVPMWVYDLATLRFLAVNDAAVHNYGYSREEFLAMTLKDIRPPEDVPALLKNVSQVTEGLQPPGLWRHRRKDGTIFDVEIRSHTMNYGGIRAELILATDITERKRAEETLRRSELKYRSLFESADDAILIFEPENEIILEANDKACRIYGFDKDELVGMSLKDLTQDVGRGRKQIERLLQSGLCRNFETVHFSKTRTPIHILANASVIEYQGKKAILTIQRDITERRQSEKALKESEDRYRDLVENSQDLICTHDLEGRLLSANRAATKILGYEPRHLIGHSLREILAPEMGDGFDDYLTTIRKEGKAEGLMLVKNAAGEKRIWEYSNTLRTEGVDVPIVRGLARDVTERKRAERAAKTQSRRNETILRTALDGFIIVDTEGKILEVNPAFCRMIGYTAGELRTLNVSDLGAQWDSIDIGNRIQEIRAKGFSTFETQYRRKDGTIIDLEVNANTIHLEGSELLFSSIRDITERKRAEEEARLQRMRFQSLFENSPVPIAMIDVEGQILQANRAFETTFGYLREELLGRTIVQVIVPAEKKREAADLAAKSLNGEAIELETVRRRKDGTDVPVHFFGIPFFSNEKQMGLFAMYVDLTESTSLSERLRQAQKMEAVGRLAGGVAHDFNNLLTAILGYSQLTLGRLPENHPLKNNIEEIIKAGERAAGLTHQLLAFSRKQILQPVPLNLNTVVSEIDKMLRRLIGEDIELTTKLDPDLAHVRADAGQMSQVLMNLAINSRDAMPRGGKLIVETRNVDFDEVSARHHFGMVKGSYVMLAVTDTGIGMDPDTMSHVFEPFFTTKGQGKGTGLGLSTVYGIVKQSGGYIYVDSEAGLGSTFKIYLPRTDAKPEVRPESPQKTDQFLGTETILVVEDEEGVRSLIQDVLREKGYKVLEARDGTEALKLNESYPEVIDLLLTDMVMPRMNGRKLAEQLIPRRPAMKVLYMSGYTADAVVYTGILESHWDFIQKPFTTEALTHKIRAVLDKDRSAVTPG